MIEGLIGKKIGMTQIFEENGIVRPVTVLEAGPCVVVQRKTAEQDGYAAVQIGLVDAKAAKRANRPLQGHHKKADVPPTRVLREFKVEADAELKPGDAVLVSIFEGVAKVDVIGTSKGKGFQGVIKRHGFSGGKATHGSMHHRGPGSIGQAAYPAKVLRGMRGPGRMGNARVTAKNLTVLRIYAEKNLLLVEGSVPGAPGSTLLIRKSAGASKPGK
jgi:large subunit ribosomal protein L3